MDGEIVIKTRMDNNALDKQISLLEDKLDGLLEEYSLLEKAQPFQGQERELIKLGQEINSTRKKITQLRKEQLTGFTNFGNVIKDITKNIVRWGLALFGIRSAYSAITSAMATIASRDEQLASDIEYMKNALAYTLEPVVRSIVNLMKELMYYVGYITKAWTGRNIFENANKSLQNANKQAKQLQRTSASFDKFNKIGSSTSSGSGAVAPSFDLTAPDNIEPPAWIVWIADHGAEVKSLLLGIASAIVLIQIGIGALPALIIGTVVYIVTLLVSKFDEIMDLFDTVIDYLTGPFRNILIQSFGPLGEILLAPILFVVGVARGAFESFYGGIKKVVDGIIKIFKGDFKSGIRQAFSGLKDIMLAPLNALIGGINAVIKGINKINIKIPNWIPGIGGNKWSFNIPQIPKLERGGIVHNPGSGVMMGNYIAGEGRSPEAVIPLDDATLDRLGLAFARHTEINATIVNEMDSRVLSRNLAKVRNEEAFARNGGY